MKNLKLFPIDLALFDAEPIPEHLQEGYVPAEGQKGKEAGSETKSAEGQQTQTGDTDADADVSKDGPEAGGENKGQENKQDEPFKVYKTKDEFQQEFDSLFNKRFKNHKELEEKIKKINPVIESAKKYFGVENEDELSKILEEKVIERIADERGLTEEEVRETLAKERELEELRAYREAKELEDQQKIIREIQETWMRESEELKKDYPDFDFNKEKDTNEKFKALLSAGSTVREAYELSNPQVFAEKVKKNVIDSIQAGKLDIKEQGTKSSPGASVKVDVSKFTDEQIDEINRRVAMGEVITEETLRNLIK